MNHRLDDDICTRVEEYQGGWDDAMAQKPEPLAVVKGYVQLGEVEHAIEHPDYLWSITVDPFDQICESDPVGVPVTVIFEKRKP